MKFLIVLLFTLFVQILNAQNETTILNGSVVYLFVFGNLINSADSDGNVNLIPLESMQLGLNYNEKAQAAAAKNMVTISKLFSSYFENGYELVSSNGTYYESSYIFKRK